jgi:ribose/xylose/arabinose/galactoside ABC-type transport system permease subunit
MNVPTTPALSHTRTLGAFLARYGIWAFFVLLVAIPAATNPDFRSVANLQGFLTSAGVLVTLTMGEAFVLLVAGVDLSVGAAAALGSVVVTLALVHPLPLVLALVLTVVVTTACGIASGLAVAYLGLPSFIVTFGMLGLQGGAALVISGGNRISMPTTSSLPTLASGVVLGVPYQIWLTLILLVLGSAFLRYVRAGRHLYAVGSNLNAARLSGVPVQRILVLAFALSGLFAGIGGIIYAARIVSGDPLGQPNLNLQAIAAAVIGGVSLFGGRGTLVGAFLGALVYALITNVLDLYGVNPNITELVSGLIIIAAAYTNVASVRAKG